jgi:hypothetical protein
MDRGAELTLQIARLLQQRADATRSPVGWSFWPQGGRATWEEARAFLAAAAKPVLVAPLVEPGALGVFTLDQFPEPVQRQMASQFANQLGYYTEKLEHLGLGDGASLRFEPGTPECVLSVSEFMQWARDYAIGVGISIARGPDAGVGRIIVRPPGGGRPPLGA